MQEYLLSNRNGVQINVLESLQQSFCSRRGGRPFGISSIQAGQLLLDLSQSPSNDKLQQSQHPQTDRQQADQPGHPPIIFQEHRRQRQSSAFQTGKAPFHQVFIAISQDSFCQRQIVLRSISSIYSPTKASDGFLDSGLIPADRQAHFSFDAHFGRTISIFAHLAFLHLFGVAQIQQTFYPVLAQDFFRRLAQDFYLGEVRFPLLALIQGFQGHLGFIQSLPQSGFGSFDDLERADEQAPLAPSHVVPVHRSTQVFCLFKSFGDRFFFAFSVWAIDGCQNLLPAPHRLQLGFQRFIRELETVENFV